MVKSPQLYHCLYRAPEGDALQPTCERTVNGRDGTFLFAADRITKSLAFAFSYHKGEVMFNGEIEGTLNEFVVLCGGQAVLDKPRSITVLSFPNEGFERMGATCQWVSEEPMPFDKTTIVLKTHSINQLMRHGLQILLLPETAAQLQSENFIERYCFNENNPLVKMKEEKGLRWINEEREINPCAVLGRKFETRPLFPPNLSPTPQP